MLRFSTFRPSAALLSLIAAPLAAQDVDSIEVTPHNVTRPVTQNTGTGVGACQQFLPWAYANDSRARQRQTFVWSVSNSTDFQVDPAGGNVCARQTQLSDTVTTTVTATITGTQVSGTASFTVTPDPAVAPGAVAGAPPPPPPNATGAAGAATAAGQTRAGETQGDTTILPSGPVPTNVTVTAISPTTLRISWEGVPGATGYQIYRSSTAGGPFTALTRAPVQGNQTTDPTLMPKTTAHYAVSALVPNQRESMSAAVSGTTLPASNPASVTATLSANQKSVALSWPAPTGASGYTLYKNGDPVSKTPLRTTTYADTGLVPGTIYKYQVAALYSSPQHGEFEGDLTNMPTATVATRREETYRLLLTGFKVNLQTNDDPFQEDGKGDEVYFAVQLLNADPQAGTVEGTLFESPTMGDKNGFPSRLQYGSASSLGGLKTGDDIRFPQPWEVWQGRLWQRPVAPGQPIEGNAILITPSVWEFDGVNMLYRAWQTNMDPATGRLVQCARQIGVSAWVTNSGVVKDLSLMIPSRLCSSPQPEPYYKGTSLGGINISSGRDSWIGLYGDVLRSLALNLDTAEGLLKGATGVDLTFRYANDPNWSRMQGIFGKYEIYLRLERLRPRPTAGDL